MTIIEEMNHFYNAIDNKVDMHYAKSKKKPPCTKGCNGCCHQFFDISSIEYIFIYQEIKKWNKRKLNKIVSRAKEHLEIIDNNCPDLYKYIMANGTESPEELLHGNRLPERLKLSLPCIFLDVDDGSCLIYKYRPGICRITGVGYTDRHKILGRICPEIKSYLWARSWQVDMVEECETIFNCNIFDPVDYSEHINYQSIMFKMHPIVYYVYRSFTDVNVMKIDDGLLYQYNNVSKSDFANSLFESNIIS